MVLEAQRRAGGRVLTWREPFTDGLYDDVGAARIPDNHDWTLKYVQHFGLSLTPFYPDEQEFLSYLRGASIRGRAGQPPDLSRYPLVLTPEEQALGLHGLVQKALGEVLRESSDLCASRRVAAHHGDHLMDKPPMHSVCRPQRRALLDLFELTRHRRGLLKVVGRTARLRRARQGYGRHR